MDWNYDFVFVFAFDRSVVNILSKTGKFENDRKINKYRKMWKYSKNHKGYEPTQKDVDINLYFQDEFVENRTQEILQRIRTDEQ